MSLLRTNFEALYSSIIWKKGHDVITPDDIMLQSAANINRAAKQATGGTGSGSRFVIKYRGGNHSDNEIL